MLILHEQEQVEPIPPDFPHPDQAAASGADVNQPALGPAPTPSRKAGGVEFWLRDLLISAAASVLIITFLYQPVRVEGTSMLPRLEDQDRLFINKFVYRFSAIERGDVVVFHYPRDPEKSYIKRVIALPGDRLRIDHGTVWINGQPQLEKYVPEEYRDSRLHGGDGSSRRPLLHDGRPPFHLLRQPRVRPRGAFAHLRKSRLRLLAGARCGTWCGRAAQNRPVFRHLIHRKPC